MFQFPKINTKALVDIPFFLFSFAFTFSGTITIDFVIHRTCYVSLNYNRSDCDLLGKGNADDKTKELEEESQAYATQILTAASLVVAIIPPVLCFFIGPWTNTYGRKPLIIVSTLGLLVYNVVFLVISAIPYASPWYIALGVIPMCLSGGIPALITSLLSSVIDVTKEEERGPRMGILEVVNITATVIGQVTASFALDAWGYVTIYAICVGCLSASLLYTIFFIAETIENPEKKGRLRNLLKISVALDTLKTTFRKRDDYKRALLIVLIFITFSFLLTKNGNTAVLFLYLRKTFNWSLEQYNLYGALMDVCGIFGSIIGTFFLHKFLNLSEAYVIVVGLISVLSGTLFQGLAKFEWQIYAAGALKLFGDAITPMQRSLLSKLVPQEEVSKIFSTLSAMDIIGNLLGISVFTYFYNLTLPLNSAAFLFLATAIHGLQLFLIGLVLAVQKHKKGSPKSVLSSDDME